MMGYGVLMKNYSKALELYEEKAASKRSFTECINDILYLRITNVWEGLGWGGREFSKKQMSFTKTAANTHNSQPKLNINWGIHISSVKGVTKRWQKGYEWYILKRPAEAESIYLAQKNLSALT